MLRVWDNTAESTLYFDAPSSSLDEAELTNNARVITRADGLQRLIADPKAVYPGAAFLYLSSADFDALGSDVQSYLANWMAYALQKRIELLLCQGDEQMGDGKVYRVSIVEFPKQLAPYCDWGDSLAGSKKPIKSMADLTIARAQPLSAELMFRLQVIEDGNYDNYMETALAGADNDLRFSAHDAYVMHQVVSCVFMDSMQPNADVVLVAQDAYKHGEGGRISVEFFDPETLGASLTVYVMGHYIKVSLATNAITGAICSTAAQIVAAIAANADASALVVATAEGAGNGIVNAIAESFLPSAGVYPTADIGVWYLDPGGNNQPLTVSLLHRDAVHAALRVGEAIIRVSLATDGIGVITSTGRDIMDAVNADAEASQLVVASLLDAGTGVVTAMNKTWVTGWSDRAGMVADLKDRGY